MWSKRRGARNQPQHAGVSRECERVHRILCSQHFTLFFCDRFIRSRNAVNEDALQCLPHHYMDQYPSFKLADRMVQLNTWGNTTCSAKL